ncbi:MAG: ABC transporter permease [Spirochaetota bacterium]|nr:ABC transporter permease [Spirochaetota bacterium]
MKKLLAVLIARNKEFYRDKSSLGWSIAFPALIILGFAFVFSDDNDYVYKVGVYKTEKNEIKAQDFLNIEYIQFIEFTNLEKAIDKIRYHQIDLLIASGTPTRYWINKDSKNGYFLERILMSYSNNNFIKQSVSGREVRYVDWVIPGVLGMNMMFNCLFGVGYVIVQYRSKGILKRLKATPLHAFQFLSAHVASRLIITLCITSFIFIACYFTIDFVMRGSFLNLMIVAIIGAISLISIGLLAACRTTSQELSNGILNLISMPMMFLSGVWFSLEGSPSVIIIISKFLPLTHLINAAREIMIDGATLMQVADHILILATMSAIFLIISPLLFRWDKP